MLCEICKKQYAVLTRMIDRGYGEERVAVCNECIKSIDNKDMKLEYIDDFWGNARKLTKCGSCGTEIESILKTGYVGCATCYKIFSHEIAELVGKIQGKFAHVGKVPLTETDRIDREADVSSLMDKALQTDDFNLAEIVRNHFPGKRR